MGKASAPMRIGGKQKESTPVSKATKPSAPTGSKALKRVSNASKKAKR